MNGYPASLAGGGRLAPIDAARGIAIGAMVLYHLCWDLSFLGLAGFDLGAGWGWLVARTAILSAFLVISGVTLVIGHGARPAGPPRLRAALRRTLVLAAAAGAITAASLMLFPQAPILFGVLHLMAVAGVLALALVGRPPLLVLGLALAALILPVVARSPAFDSPWWLWLGLAVRVADSNDYVPLLPWFGIFLIGVAGGEMARARGVFARESWRTPAPGRLLRGLRWAGQRSLALYLIHQPVLLGLLVGGLWLSGEPVPWLSTGRSPGAVTGSFRDACHDACTRSGVAAERCARYCTCADRALAGSGLVIGQDGLPETEQDRARMFGLFQTCAVETGAAPGTP